MLISTCIFIRGKQRGEKLSSLTYLFYLFTFLFNIIPSLDFWYFTAIPCGQIVWCGCDRESAIFKKGKKKKDCHTKQVTVQRKEPRSFILSHSTRARILQRSDTYAHKHMCLHHHQRNITVSGKADGYQAGAGTTEGRTGKVWSEGRKAFLPREHHGIADILPGQRHDDAHENHPPSERPRSKLICMRRWKQQWLAKNCSMYTQSQLKPPQDQIMPEIVTWWRSVLRGLLNHQGLHGPTHNPA